MLDSNVLVSCVRGYSIGNHSVYNFTCAILVRTSSQRRRRSASDSVIGCSYFTTQINSVSCTVPPTSYERHFDREID